MGPTPRLDATDTPYTAGSGKSVGLFLAAFAVLLAFSYSSTPLLRYPDRAIGVGLMGGVDPARRFTIYLGLVALAVSIWLACHYGARLLARRRPGWFLGVRSRLENDVCALFAAAGGVALVARVSVGQLDRLGPAQLCAAAVGVMMAFALVRRTLTRPRWISRQLCSLNMLGLTVLLAWPAAQISAVLADVRGADRLWLVRLGTLLLPVAYGILLGYCVRRPGRATSADVSRAFALGAAPFFAFPSLCPVANEIQHTLAGRYAIEPRSVALWGLGLLAAIGGVLFWQARRGSLRMAPRYVLSRCVFPTVIFGQALIAVYRHTVSAHVDPLHDGEQATAVHQLLRFDKWPFVDIWPAHGLFDYVGAVNALVNGFQPLEIAAYNGLLSALSATAVYAVLANLHTPLFAFAVASMLPIEAILPLPQYSFFYAEPGLLAVGLLATATFARPSLRRYLLLSLAAFLCFFWTPTSGVGAIAAVFGLLVLSLFTTPARRPVWQGLGVFAGTGVAVFLAYVLVLALRGQPVLQTLRLVRGFMQADPLIGGYPAVLEHFDASAFVQYLLLPGIGIVYLVRLARHAIERKPLERAEQLLGFLTLVSFVLFARTLTRHGIIERFQPFYFPLLALCFALPRRAGAGGMSQGVPSAHQGGLATHMAWRANARGWFCAGLALYLVWFPLSSYKRLVFDPFEFHTWQAGERRLEGDVPRYPQLSAFLKSTLGPRDTFLELLNMPLLYGLLDREVPGQFFLPTMFYGTDSIQNAFLERLAAFGGSARVPVVLLPDTGGRNIDRIENAFRSYRISEHVYREYVPFGTLDGFAVWVSRARWEEAAQASAPHPLSLREPTRPSQYASVRPPLLDGDVLQITATGDDPRVDDVAAVDGIRMGGVASHHALQLSYRTSISGPLTLFYRFSGRRYNGQDYGRARLVSSPSGAWQTILVPIPPQADPELTLEALRVAPPHGAQLEIKDLTLVFGTPWPAVSQAHAAGMLPFFWGNFDEHRAAQKAPVLETLEVPKTDEPVTAVDLTFPASIDKRSGNYLKLCIRLPELSGARKPARWKTVAHGDSWMSAGNVTLTYGKHPSARFEFELVQPTPGAIGIPEALVRSFAKECKTYLARLSTQYAWSNQPISIIKLSSNAPILLESASLLAGD